MLFSNFIFFNPWRIVPAALRGETMDFAAPLSWKVYSYFVGCWHPSWTLVGLAVIGAFFLAMAGLTVFRGHKELLKRGLGPAVAFLVISVAIAQYAGDKPTPPPPPIRVTDIKITKFKCDHTGLEIQWQFGTNVVYGVDTFVIQRKTRQIPSRTGWSPNWEDFDTTMVTNYLNSTPFHAQDNRFRVIVRKEAN